MGSETLKGWLMGAQILWTKQYIGSTNSILGIYQIATALRYLARWSVDVFWPWYRQAILEFQNDC